MTQRTPLSRILLIGVFTLILTAAFSVAAMAAPFGIGQSKATDAEAAGAEAAQQAADALEGEKPQLVLVFNSDALASDHEAMLAGVSGVFDADVIHGCNTYSPLTSEGSDSTVAILAIAGDVEITIATAETAGPDDDVACGKRIGEQLQAAAAAPATGRLLLLFGACHVPRDNQLVQGVSSVLGETFPIIGGAAKGDLTYAKGKSIPNSNVGILFTGDFSVGTALKKDMSKEGLITSAGDAFREAIGDNGQRLVLTLVCDCGGRRGKMLENGNYPEEVAAMKAAAGDSPIFGFYGSGEIGCDGTGAAPAGVGYHIATAAIFAE